MPYYLEKSWERSHKHFPEGMHLGMINDPYRLTRYHEFFKAHAKDKVILDVGAGLGLIGLKALEFGAAHIYLVEQNPITAKALNQLVSTHPQSHKITVIEHDFHSVNSSFFSTPPDLLVCELWGPHMWNEGLHATHKKAKELFPKIEIYPAKYKSYFNIVSISPDDTQIWPREQLAGVNLTAIYKDQYLGYLLDRAGVKHTDLTERTECFSLSDDKLVSHFEKKIDSDYSDVFFHLWHEIHWPDHVDYYRSTYFYIPELKRDQTVRMTLDDHYLPLFDLI